MSHCSILCAAGIALAVSVAAVSMATAASAATAPATPAADGAPRPCRLAGVETEALCGHVARPLDPALPQGPRIDVHYAVLPALARNKWPDPVFALAGGPGQSAIELAGSYARLLARLTNRRDIVLVDQRGTGRSARLACESVPPGAPLAELARTDHHYARLAACRAALERNAHGDLRHYTTWVAMQDLDAVRRALGAERINLVGSSYGTRAALEYQRQFPQAVRRLVIDGVAPPDMVLPAAFSADGQAALDAVFESCQKDAGCAQRHPALRSRWQALLASLPREVQAVHPFTGVRERFTLPREAVLTLVRPPLYAPGWAAGLPEAIAAATEGRFEPLLGLSGTLQGSRAGSMAEGMHFSVICSEDFPRLTQGAGRIERAEGTGAEFGDEFALLYRRVCADWPRGAVPEAFYTLAPSAVPALVLSGGADPATPPRHGERAARALGPRARHVVVPHAGHGVLALPCWRDALFRFIDAADDAAAQAVAIDCAAAVPRPPAFVPPDGRGR